MDRQNRKDLESLGYKNVYLIGDYGGYGGADVPDPYFFEGFSGFEKVYEMLDISVRDFLKREQLW
jgi:protein-tyrosine phosphatase